MTSKEGFFSSEVKLWAGIGGLSFLLRVGVVNFMFMFPRILGAVPFILPLPVGVLLLPLGVAFGVFLIPGIGDRQVFIVRCAGSIDLLFPTSLGAIREDTIGHWFILGVGIVGIGYICCSWVNCMN